MNKKELRAKIKAKKSALTEQQIVDCSSRLAQQLFRHPAYQAAKSIYGYLSFNEEVRTVPILRQAQLDGKRVAVPKVFGDTMRFLWLDDLDAVAPGYYGVPVAFLSGDADLCAFARELIPEIVTVPVNRGVGGGVVSLHPAVAVERIRAGAEEAVKKADRCRVHMPDHFESVIRFREHKLAYSKSFYPGARLEDGKNVCFDSDDWYEMLRYFHFVLSD